MEKNEFYSRLIEYLELENVELSEDTYLMSLDGYDSLARMSIIAFADEYFNVKLKGEDIRQLSNVASLMKLIGIERFK